MRAYILRMGGPGDRYFPYNFHNEQLIFVCRLCKGLLSLTSIAITKVTFWQAIIILAKNYCDSSYIVPNIFYSLATVVR
jgi:hypothetical protein